MTLDMSEIRALADRLKGSGKTMRAEAHNAVRDTTKAVKQAAVSLAPVGPTGQLRAGITGRTSGLVGTVESTAPYAAYVEFGTSDTAPQPHILPALDREETAFGQRLEDGAVKATAEAVGG